MSYSHILDLGSQNNLLDRLELLTNFSSNIITINGDTGSGKSWLAKRYLEIKAKNKNQCLLLSHTNFDNAQKRTQILQQLVSGALFNQHDPLLTSLEHLLVDQKCDFVIVIDDAHLLDYELLSELWSLVLTAQVKPVWTINVVLFTKTGALNEILDRLSHGQELKTIEFKIEMLSATEAEKFFETFVLRHIDDNLEKRVTKAFSQTSLTPGAIMELSNIKVEKFVIIRSIITSPTRLILISIIALLLIIASYTWVFNQSSLENTLAAITNLPTTIDNIEPVALDPSSQDNYLDIAHDKQPSVSGDLLQLLADHQQKKNTAPIISSKFTTLPKPTADLAHNNVDMQSIENSLANLSPLNSMTYLYSNMLTTFTNLLKHDHKKLQAIPARSYVIQLASLTTMEEVANFLTSSSLSGLRITGNLTNPNISIYKAIKENEIRYIVTYNSYPTHQAASYAISKLNKDIKLLNPWAKEINQVKLEMLPIEPNN